MSMTRKQRRLAVIALGLCMLGGATALVLSALSDSIVFFNSPSDILARPPSPSQRLRLGGLVATGSVEKLPGEVVHFTVTDGNSERRVVYTGVLPDLFREGQGVVTEGRLQPDGMFKAETVLAKHDENYMPREVADALKKQGVWHGDEAAGKAKAQGKPGS